MKLQAVITTESARLKRCWDCGEWKPLDGFYNHRGKKDGKQTHCKACIKEDSFRNREIKLARSLKWNAENKERKSAYDKARYVKNKGKFIRYQRGYKKGRYDNDLGFRIQTLLRGRVLLCVRKVKGRKDSSSSQLLGCTTSELRAYLGAQFKPGMTWENYGRVWHIDHKRPCSWFDLTDPVQQRLCFHYTNLQPLFVKENLSKGNRYES